MKDWMWVMFGNRVVLVVLFDGQVSLPMLPCGDGSMV